jgi:hypothetical protein
MDAMPAGRRSVVHMMVLRHMRERMPAVHASNTYVIAMGSIITDETAPFSARCIWPLICFSSRHPLGVWMDEKRVWISGPSGRRTGHPSFPDDLSDEIFRSQIHIDGERLDTYQSQTGIAQLLGVEPGKRQSFAPSKTSGNRIRSNILMHGN